MSRECLWIARHTPVAYQVLTYSALRWPPAILILTTGTGLLWCAPETKRPGVTTECAVRKNKFSGLVGRIQTVFF